MPRSTRRCASLARLTGLAAATALSVAMIAAPVRAAAPQDTSLEKVSNLVEPSIVQLHATYTGLVRDDHGTNLNGGTPIRVDTTCSGFVVNANGYIATSGRCVDLDVAADALIDKAAQDVFENDPELVPGVTSLSGLKGIAQRQWNVVSPRRGHRERPDRKVTATSELIAGEAANGDALPVSVRRVRGPENGDVALVKIQAQDLPALALAPDADLQPGIPTVSVGFRGSANDAAAGLGSSFQPGAIGAPRTVDGGLNRAFEVKAAISPAMAGGPTVDFEGQVLGVNRSRSARSTQPFGLISPATEIQQLLQDVGAPNDLGDASRAYRNGLNAFFRGDRGTALAGFNRTLEIQPEFKLAEEFRNRAQKLSVPKARKAGDGGWSEWLIALLSSPVLAALVGGLGVIRRRRQRSDNPPSLTSVQAAADETAALVVQDGRQAGHRVAVSAELVIGRRDADLVLDDSHVSRRHALVRPIKGGLEIEDLGSANGTLVNGVAIEGSRRLGHGDVVQVGRLRLTADVAAACREVTVLAGDASGAHVAVIRGPLAGRCYAVGTELVIGRQDSDLLVDDPRVSRRHALVRAVDGELEVEDLGSANGTFVNGARVDEPQRLGPGDEIAIGPVVLAARTGDEREVAAGTVATVA
jgi:serine protease Do